MLTDVFLGIFLSLFALAIAKNLWVRFTWWLGFLPKYDERQMDVASKQAAKQSVELMAILMEKEGEILTPQMREQQYSELVHFGRYVIELYYKKVQLPEWNTGKTPSDSLLWEGKPPRG